MKDFLEQMSGNSQMMAGAAVIAAVITLSNPKLRSAVGGKLAGAMSWLGSFFPGKTTPDLDLDGEVACPMDVHELVNALMSYFKAAKDEEGVKYAARIGTHLYEQALLEPKVEG